ncbi:polysaccharide lyase family 7 protein [Pseudomonas protegens]|uniref:polysaccharide lyase family 7 protein n=1 Tax=Pseudomonas protegens TaxID=380021 RepID=UPI00080714AF|nr:polysaccharide lyase family 7 protein [Pseudomonas protegens]OBZ20175.1 alginate lyase [Pseudomonas protegens]OBZ21278.1 alginate lyase [Pseudomonas protegens]OKK40546.1 polysaccharide lyase family 7 protein [Pseudomonas protegens]OKK52860.1 polysaccharide lyase family 7 protein [Pseudomonas protegens]OKK58352.1 polysaccharide lyase family 7 protein [Pseudomonas protegens]
MAGDILPFMITTPVASSPSNPVALELTVPQALAQVTQVISQLPDGSIRMSAPPLGASSKRTHHTRCEWKEPLYWSLASAQLHSNRQVMRLTQANSAQKVVISQMHVKDDDSPAFKVFWNKDRIAWDFRASFDQGGSATRIIATNVPLQAPFEITLSTTTAGLVLVVVICNGVTSTSTSAQLDSSWNDQRFDFRGRVYNQVDYSGSTPASDGSVCIISELQVSHTLA